MNDAGILRLRGQNLHWCDADGEVVALDVKSSVYLATNRTGSRLWHALAAGATEAQLTTLLVKRYGLSPEEAAADVERFVVSLRAGSLLDS